MASKSTSTTRPAQPRRTTKRGAFIDALWHCDCEPRLPADKFQVKNGGKNHGRWFYTCQKPQHKRCGFFLWSDDAKVREEAAVLNNSRSEYPPLPQTPRKPNPVVPPTPETNRRPDDVYQSFPSLDKKVTPIARNDSFGWSSSDDESLLKAEQEFLLQRPPFETPRKAARTTALSSPGKRTHGDMDAKSGIDEQWPLSDDVFATPSTSYPALSTGLLSPSSAAAKQLSQPVLGENTGEYSALTMEVMAILRGVSLSSETEKKLVDVLDKHDLRTQGIVKGRDITRVAVQTKETKIAELQARISVLEAERETNRTVISLMKHDIATSPKKGPPRKVPLNRRSEV
ncbi:hypothetical protein LTR84_011212 [Exophiala bonariae]|uniref:GRF-type domain-containing protein n=1 Tax=Exophiala bonariae TaxID=1690606 RepID=A0AAV9NL40_9EURO|nr:hypothetical protein LTR84_011212 [Exophiala bonariae]